MTIRVLDPTSEQHADSFELAQRLESLKGKRVGAITNGKEGTKGFFAALEKILIEEFGIETFDLQTKSNYSAPAEEDIVDRARDWDLAVTGIGD